MTVMTLGVCTTASAKKVVVPKMYIFGMAASFSDTIVYFTNVQEIDSAWIDTKGNFLQGRNLYSLELRNYLKYQGMDNRTCIVVANKKRSKLEKKFLKMKKLYTQSKDGKLHYDIRFINDQDFKFRTIDMSDEFDNPEHGE
jgi:hypothetical protein